MRELLIEKTTSVHFNIEKEEENETPAKIQKWPNFLDISSNGTISLELCPNLRELDCIDPPYSLLSELDTNFCSVTWHSQRAQNITEVDQIPAVRLATCLLHQGHQVLLHLAGRNLSKRDAFNILDTVKRNGVKNIFAIQGDPTNKTESQDQKSDFHYAADLVRFIRKNYENDFTIGVAGYPEKHPNCSNLQEDILNLRSKVSCGADYIITQATYNYKALEKFANLCRCNNINIPIIAGVYIINSYKSLLAMSTLCGIPISEKVLSIVRNNRDNDAAIREFGLFHAQKMTQRILTRRDLFRSVHIFTLNDVDLAGELLKRLGMYKLFIERPL